MGLPLLFQALTGKAGKMTGKLLKQTDKVEVLTGKVYKQTDKPSKLTSKSKKCQAPSGILGGAWHFLLHNKKQANKIEK